MTDLTLILDLTCTVDGARDTLQATRQLVGCRWNVLLAHSEIDGRRGAQALAADDGRVTTLHVGSGTGACDWAKAVRHARGTHVVFLRPGDCLAPHAAVRLGQLLHTRQASRWALGAADGAPNNTWWFQRDLAGSAAALLLAGAAFPECTALVARDAWLHVAERFPETMRDASRATAWMALALVAAPLVLPEVIATTQAAPMQVDVELLREVLEAAARRHPAAMARLMTDVARLTSGLRLGWALYDQALAASWIRLGEPTRSAAEPHLWHQRWSFLSALLARGDRPVWIWGAGQLGLEALGWLQAHRIPVQGFLDGDATRDGQQWGGLPVSDGVRATVDAGQAPPLIVIASMYHVDIVERLRARGLRPALDVVVYERRLPRLRGVEDVQ